MANRSMDDQVSASQPASGRNLGRWLLIAFPFCAAFVVYLVALWKSQPEFSTVHLGAFILVVPISGLFEFRGFFWPREHRWDWIPSVAVMGLTLMSFLLGSLLLATIALTLALWTMGWLSLDATAKERMYLLLGTIALPLLFTLDGWKTIHDYFYALIARFTSALLDGFQIPNIRSEFSLELSHQILDTSKLGDQLISLEVLTLYTSIYCVLRGTKYLPTLLTLILMSAIWISIRTAYCAMIGYSTEYQSLSSTFLDQLGQHLFWLGLIPIPIVELFFRSVTAPVASDAVASEFPLFVDLYNWITSVPSFGFATLENQESAIALQGRETENE